MATATIVYQGELKTLATHIKSGQQFITDPPPDNNGKGEAFSPTDLLATSLGCCMLTIMGMVAAKNQLNINGTKINVVKVMAANPRRVSEIHIEMTLPAHSFSPKDKALLEDAALTCPVAKSLHPDIKQEVKFIYQ